MDQLSESHTKVSRRFCMADELNGQALPIFGTSRVFGLWLWKLVHLLNLVCSFQWWVLFMCLIKLWQRSCTVTKFYKKLTTGKWLALVELWKPDKQNNGLGGGNSFGSHKVHTLRGDNSFEAIFLISTYGFWQNKSKKRGFSTSILQYSHYVSVYCTLLEFT